MYHLRDHCGHGTGALNTLQKKCESVKSAFQFCIGSEPERVRGQSGRTRLSAGPWLLLLLGCPTLVIVMTMGMILAMLKLFLPLHNIFVSTKMWYPPHWQQEGWRRPRGIPRRLLYKQPGNIFLSLNDPFSSRSTKTRQSIQSN